MTEPLSTADMAHARETILRSLIGPQPTSGKESAPAWVFGSGDRSGALMNPGGGGKRSVGLSPGPIYLPSPRGRDSPRYSFGGAASSTPSRRAGAAPGPGEYDAPKDIGTDQALSVSRNAPRYGWGTGGRDKLGSGGMMGLASRPACNEFYELTEAIGPQPVSTRATRPAYSLSMDSRFDDRQRTRKLAAAPGPGAYNTIGGTGTQADSTKATQPQYGFSRGNRFRQGNADPANRNREARLVGDLRSAVGRQVMSERKSKPQYRFGTARRFEWDRPASAAARYDTPGPGSYNA